MKNQQEQLLLKRFPIITGLAMLICFILFPLFLVNNALNRILGISSENKIQTARQKLEKPLDYLESHSNDAQFVHRLLSQEFARADSHPQAQAKLESSVKQLKKAYPGTFFIVAWDQMAG